MPTLHEVHLPREAALYELEFPGECPATAQVAQSSAAAATAGGGDGGEEQRGRRKGATATAVAATAVWGGSARGSSTAAAGDGRRADQEKSIQVRSYSPLGTEVPGYKERGIQEKYASQEEAPLVFV